MPFTSEKLLEMNTLVGGGGAWKERTRGKVNAEEFCQKVNTGGTWDLPEIVALGRAIVTGQWFTDGNHRTGLLVLYWGMIDNLDFVTRKPAFQLFAKLDYRFYEAQTGRSPGAAVTIVGTDYDPHETILDFIQNGGTMKLVNPQLVEAQRQAKLQEVIALPMFLGEITEHKAYDVVNSDKDLKSRKEMANSESYQRNKVRMKIFKALNGGSLSHSSER